MIGVGKVSEQQVKNLFEKADADKSGAIDYGEFKQVRNNATDNLSQVVCQKTFIIVVILGGTNA